ncbi:hypothetical protein MIND_01193500 [Mycena indigotica]|uniref:Uncharacterized protein n=1 Tax=Mycena indigotica TaxID=2126181 RepID=A0A8H6S5Y0_9AGAR|nr:uncharacterized protein MIND_01193500 [Mycena indigotica]KAF7292943.1 hypothetical protein MIND_01193500 [Mycena indigotica]
MQRAWSQLSSSTLRLAVFAGRSHVSLTRRTLSQSLVDPARAELHYHLVEPPSPFSDKLPAFALSFLPTAPSSASSSTVLGWLPAAAATDGQEAGLNDFKENPQFRSLLHEAIQAGLREQVDDIQINGAAQIGSGWMHIHDDRNIPALGRIGDPDDIIASVLVEDGKIQPETYQAMPAYRLCTSDGPIQLTFGLARKLQTVLEARARAETT